mmetsp:Transcript_20993/g.83705  ORF Transcript_20993/g.83705 Transcript_20993/m.83705 type:complete len:204 (-) Transcript_20993:3-614(-)
MTSQVSNMCCIWALLKLAEAMQTRTPPLAYSAIMSFGWKQPSYAPSFFGLGSLGSKNEQFGAGTRTSGIVVRPPSGGCLVGSSPSSFLGSSSEAAVCPGRSISGLVSRLKASRATKHSAPASATNRPAASSAKFPTARDAPSLRRTVLCKAWPSTRSGVVPSRSQPRNQCRAKAAVKAGSWNDDKMTRRSGAPNSRGCTSSRV